MARNPFVPLSIRATLAFKQTAEAASTRSLGQVGADLLDRPHLARRKRRTKSLDVKPSARCRESTFPHQHPGHA
jgi:hypothetical protein